MQGPQGVHEAHAGKEPVIFIWIWLWNLFHSQVKRVPVTVHITDGLHGKDKTRYYQVYKHRHVRI